MTLPASGAISFSDINTELGLTSTATLILGDPAPRLLAGVASGAISLSDFYGKSWGIVDTFTKTSSTSWSQSIELGPDKTGRETVIVALYTFDAANPATNTGATIGSTSLSGDSHGSFPASGTGNAVWIGMGAPTGTSGTLTMTWSHAAAGRIVVFSIVAGATDDSDFASGDRTGITGDTLSVDETSGGVLITAFNSNSTGAITETGVDWIKAYTEGTVGYKKLTSTASGASVAWSGAAHNYPTFFAQSYGSA